MWDVLSNKEVVDVVASAPSRSSAARTLVETAVRAWRFKYPTSKVDDCAVVCLFLDSSNNPNNISTASAAQSKEQVAGWDQMESGVGKEEGLGPSGLERSGTMRNGEGEMHGGGGGGGNKEEEAESGIDWSALEGVSRVNTLLTLPRFVPGKDDKRATGKTS